MRTYYRFRKIGGSLALMILLSMVLQKGTIAAAASGPLTEPVDSGTVITTDVPTDTSDPGTTPSPIPIGIPTPDASPTPDPAITPTPDPSVTPSPAPTVTPVPTATPTPIPADFPDTLRQMLQYDFLGNSITGISTKKLSVKTLQARVLSYGKLYGTGMPYDEYKQAMSFEWVDAKEYGKKPVQVTVNITNSMDYNTYVNTLKKLSRYDGFNLFKIGKSTEGRDLYAIEIDVKSDRPKKVFMLTGQVHAREFAGGTFIVKQFADLIQKAQTDKKTMDFLKSYKFVAVPIINVDGREALIKEQRSWTTRSGQLWKAYTNGVEGNRNFPGLQWGQVSKGSSLKSIIESKPTYANYPGNYAGSNNETKAMMKWFYQYVVVEQAAAYLDLHQQGAIVYAGKGWQTEKEEQFSRDLRTKVLSLLNSGNMRRKYNRVYETASSSGLQGQGSSLTDYSITLAVGAKFSPAFGFSAFTDGKKEYMLMEIKDLDYNKIRVKAANEKFAALTIEIGYGENYLGNSFYTRNLLAKEYTNYKFDKLLTSLPYMVK